MPDSHPQFILDIHPSADLSEDAFVVGDANGTAHKAIASWPKWQSPTLAIVGPSGAGKTHLGSIWVERAGARLLPLEMLSERHIRDGLTSPLCLDAGNRLYVRHEDVLFHALNLAKEEDSFILILSQQPPARWDIKLADLSSRLKAVPVLDIELPDDALLADVLKKNFADMGIKAPEAVLTYLTTRMERSYAQAATLARLIGERSLAAKRRVTVPFVAEFMDQPASDA